MKKLTIKISIIVLLSTTAFAQNNSKPNSPKSYWLKYSLVFFKGCQPRVFPHNIIFDEGDCFRNPHRSRKLIRGMKVGINFIDKEEGFAKVSIKHWATDYVILLKNDSEGVFRKSFNLLFSEKEVPEGYNSACSSDLETKKQVIKCLGFPLYVDKDGDVEKYRYVLEFVGFSYFSYDGWTIEIKHGKVIKILGNI